MFVQHSEICPQLTLSIDIQIGLVSEENYATNGYQTSQVIFLGIGQLGQVDSVDLGANLWIVVKDVGGIFKKIPELRMAIQAFVMIGHFGQRTPMDVREAGTKIIVLIVYTILYGGAARFIVDSLRYCDRLPPAPIDVDFIHPVVPWFY